MKKRLFISLLQLCIGYGAFAQEGLLWEISGKGLKKNAYLLGTYHLMPGSYVGEIYLADKLLQKSKTVVVETLIDSNLLPSLALYMADPEGGAWVQKLSSGEQQLLDSSLKVLTGIGLEVFGSLKPAAVSNSLALVLSKMATDSLLSKFKGEPMDIYIANQALRNKKQRVIGLESLESQFALLYNTPPIDSQLFYLQNMLAELDSLAPAAQALALAYMQQDASGMQAMLREFERSYGSTEALLRARNERWLEQLPGLFKAGQTFVAVGALHLYGSDGLIEGLRKAGYRVEAVTKKSTQLSMFESGMDVVMWMALLTIFLTADNQPKPKTEQNTSS